jgi:hypothetical protein
MTVTGVTPHFRLGSSTVGLRPAIFKRLAQALQFETGTKQCEQARHKDDPALDRQKEVGFRSEIGEMPEDHDGKQRAAENMLGH